MSYFDLPDKVVDERVYEKAVAHLRETGIVLPTFSDLRDPSRAATTPQNVLASVDPDSPHPANLFRVHWFNDESRRGRVDVPHYIEVPPELSGVKARILVMVGSLFPMIRAHKVLAAYACLAPRLAAGLFDPLEQRAVWPSTGNYCRGGVAISRMLKCRGVAVLPEGMSAERFEWLDAWVEKPEDIVRTPGSESNVKEIYDKCAELAKQPRNVVLNQFSEFGNYLAHYSCTGTAAVRIFEDAARARGPLHLAAFVAGTGSAGTLGAGDALKSEYGARIVAVEPVECPTLLYNGFGEHNIQGIGDKHVPLIHNVMNTDFVVGVSERASDDLNVLFNTEAGRNYLASRRGVDPKLIDRLAFFGLSSIANIVASIRYADFMGLDEDSAVITVATDGAELYDSERARTIGTRFDGSFDDVHAGEVWGEHMASTDSGHVAELGHKDRTRIFNLGYYTWVEQQGVDVSDFDRRRNQTFWTELTGLIPIWDRLISEMNAASGAQLAAA